MTRARAALGSPWGAVACGFAVRAVVGCAVNAQGTVHRGFDFYGFMADHVVEGRGLVWSFYDGLGDKWANRAPLYPLVLAAARWAAGPGSVLAEVLLQAALGAIACLVPAALARRWAGERGAMAAAWIAAAWPYSVVLDTAMVEHVVYAPLVGLALLAALRARESERVASSLWAGAAAGAATLARLTYPATAVLVAATLLGRPRSAARIALFAAGAAAAILPWMARNESVTGRFVLGTDGGRALWVGNSAGLFAIYPERSIDDAERARFREFSAEEWSALRAENDDEAAQDALFRARAAREIRERPAEVAWGGLRKAAALWSPIMNPGPASAMKRAAFAAGTLALLAACAAAVVSVPRLRADLPVLGATALSFTLVAAVFWGESRYVAPLHPPALAAAAAWLASRVPRSAPA